MGGPFVNYCLSQAIELYIISKAETARPGR